MAVGKIDGRLDQVPATERLSQAQLKQDARVNAQQVKEAADKAKFSSEAVKLSKMRETIMDGEDVRNDRVEYARKLLENEHAEVDAEQLAEAMMNEWL